MSGITMNIEELWKEVEEKGAGAMSFLLNKVDDSLFVENKSKNNSLLSYCLSICIGTGKSNSVENDVLISGLVKRILTIYRDKDQPISSEHVKLILEYCLLHWDAIANVVAYNSVDIFSLFLNNHSNFCEECRLRKICPVSLVVVDNVVKSASKSKARFKCVIQVLKNFDNVPGIDEEFISDIYSHLESPALSVVISEFIELEICEKQQHYDLHVTEITKILQNGIISSRNAVKDRVIPILMKNAQLPDCFLQDILSGLSAFSDNETGIESTLAIVRFAVYQPNKEKRKVLWTDFIDYQVALRAILHVSSQVRIAAWSLLTDHPKKTQSFSDDDFQLMKIFICSNISEQLPASRQKILAGLKKVLIRICESGELNDQTTDQGLSNLNKIAVFIRFLIDISFECLLPEANFSRRVMGLSIIEFIFCKDYLITKEKSKVYKFLELPNELTTERFYLLLSNLDNEYQLCQSLSVNLLCNLFRQATAEFDFESFTNETLNMITSVRTQDTLSSGFRLLYSIRNNPGSEFKLLKLLLEKCEANIKQCNKELMNITTFLVHPYLNAISFLLEQTWSQITSDGFEFLEQFVNKLLPLCFNISKMVTPVVHSLSPEGFIPEEELAAIATHNTAKVQVIADTSQLLLACCWRAHKFVSSIFGTLISKCFNNAILTVNDVEDISKYFWLQLTECKHCGAFESAVEGFAQLCSFLWKVKDTAKFPNPVNWAEEIVKALEGKNDMQKLCSTRRSAGVPHLVTTILGTEPTDYEQSKSILPKTLSSLINMEGKETTYRIHCLNVLKAIFSSSQLGERITFALEKASTLAISACSADTWPERNAGAQLAAALRVRIFGVTRNSQRDHFVDSKNKLSAFDFFSRFPSLYNYLYKQLTTGTDEFKCYPILIFLSHIFPTISSKYPLASYIPACLNVLFNCKAEKLRALTAATVISISQAEDLSFILSYLTQLVERKSSQNLVHATLLLIKHILENLGKTSQHENTIRNILNKIVSTYKQEDLADFNCNLLMLLNNELSIMCDIVNVDKFTLSWRPLTSKHLISRNVLPFIEHRILRFEYYRTSSSMKNVENGNQLLKYACDDLINCNVEREASEIMGFLLSNLELLSSDVKQSLANFLLRKTFRTLKNQLIGRQLYAVLTSNVDLSSGQYKWLKTVAEYEEDDSLKNIALDISKLVVEQNPSKELVGHVSLFLQDECDEIREMASSILSKNVLNSAIPLNPDVCFRILMSNSVNFDFYKMITHNDDQKKSGLFDVCENRPYAENRIFGDTDLILKSIGNIVSSSKTSAGCC